MKAIIGIAIFGIGGVGHLSVQFSKMAGAEVIAVDTGEAQLAMARELGLTIPHDQNSWTICCRRLAGPRLLQYMCLRRKPSTKHAR